ncbi:hypothetical protein PFISCL1PPCAC_26598, partial [Pristionchus fissidentatus]
SDVHRRSDCSTRESTMNDPSSSWSSSVPIPPGGSTPVDFRYAIVAQPRFNRVPALSSAAKNRYSGSCPTCKDTKTGEWSEIKEHVQSCRRLRQHPLLMRTCYCPYCLKRCSDYYALSSHITHNHKAMIKTLWEDFKNRRKIDEEGVHTKEMKKEKFPFECTKCEICWPTANAIAAHFVKMEKREMSCGGTVVVHIVEDTRRKTREKTSDSITARYDFAMPIVCSFCTEAFTEAYTLSAHIFDKHKQTMLRLEKNLAPLIKDNPKKKLFYEPFMCSSCHTTFKSMEQWAQHIQIRVHGGQACYGELKIVKYCKNKSRFESNVAAPVKSSNVDDPIEIEEAAPPESQTRKLTFDGTYSKEIKAEYMGMTMEAFENEIKCEPMDPDELIITEHLNKEPERTHVMSLEHDYLSPEMRARMDREKEHSDQLRAPHAGPDQVVVKEEPIDEYFEGRTAAAAA